MYFPEATGALANGCELWVTVFINNAAVTQPTSISAGKLRISMARGFALKALFASSAHVTAADSSGTGRSSVSRSGAHRARTPAAAAAAAGCDESAAAVVAAKPP
jgi:hypothetical protein